MPYQITPAASTVDENAGTLQFTVTRSASELAETLYVSTTPDQGFANSGDYQGLLNLVLSFAPGQTTATVTLTINDDSLIEGNESFGIILQAAAEDPASVFLAKTVFTIRDNDTPAGGTYAISTATPVVDEAAGTVTFTVTRTASSSAETLYVSTVPDLGSANSGDYQGLLNQAVSFAAGQTAQTVTVRITDDTAKEGDESFGIIVQRNAADTANVYLARSSFTIRDNDSATPPPPPPWNGPVLLGTYPATGIDAIGQGNRDNDDSHTPNTARQWAYDFLTPNFTDVHAVQGGTVVAVRQGFTAPMRGYGNVVTVLCDGGFYVTYGHLAANSAPVAVGDRIEAGQVIAKSGDSGSYDGTGLHPNLHVQFGTAASMLQAEFGNAATATLIADGSGDAEPAAYFPKLTIHFDQRQDPGLSTDTDYFGTRGIDDFYGNAAANRVDGLAGDDVLRGMGGNDRLNGGDGADRLDGGTGSDAMAGGKGDDLYIVDSTGDTVSEAAGEGTDVVQSAVSFTLGLNVENLVLTGTSAINGTGNVLDNMITGNAAANRITDSAGADRLDGGGGADIISGGAGDDILIGGTGRDSLTGGSGNDRFVFSSLADSVASRSGADIITDFTPGFDRIDVSAIDAKPGTPELDHFTYIGSGVFTGDGQIRAMQSGSDTVLQFNAGGDKGVEMTITLTGVKVTLLTTLDFIL